MCFKKVNLKHYSILKYQILKLNCFNNALWCCFMFFKSYLCYYCLLQMGPPRLDIIILLQRQRLSDSESHISLSGNYREGPVYVHRCPHPKQAF